MNPDLNSLDAERFIVVAKQLAGITAKDIYRAPMSPSQRPILSFDEFIALLERFTRRCGSSVALEVTLSSSSSEPLHFLHCIGIRDEALRSGRTPTLLPSRQKGLWSAILEDLLRHGVFPEQIDEFRENMRLREQDGVSDSMYFGRPLRRQTGNR